MIRDKSVRLTFKRKRGILNSVGPRDHQKRARIGRGTRIVRHASEYVRPASELIFVLQRDNRRARTGGDHEAHGLKFQKDVVGSGWHPQV